MAGFDPSVISSIADGMPNPMGAKQQAYTLAGQIDEQKLNHLKLSQAQEGMADQAKAKNILRDNPIDFSKPETITRAAEKISKEVNPDYAMKFMRQAQEVQGGQLETKIKELQVEQENMNVVSQSVNPLVSKLMDMEHAGATPAMLNAAAKSEAPKVIQGLLEAHPEMKPKIDKLLKANPNGLDYATLKTIDQNSKQGAAAIKEKLSEFQQQTRDKNAETSAKRQEDSQKNILSLIASRKEKSEAQEAGIIPPEDLKFTVGQYLAGDRQAFQGLGSTRTNSGMKNWAAARKELRLQATAEGATKGIEAKDAPRYVAGKMAAFEALKSEEKAVGTRQGQVGLAATEFYSKDPETGEEHGVSKVALDASKAVPRAKWVPMNEIMQYIDKSQSDPELAAFAQSLDSAINVYARAMTPIGVPTEASKARALDKLSTATGPGAIKATFNIMNKEIEQAVYAPDAVKEMIMSSFMKSGPKTPKAPAAPKPIPMNGKNYVKKDGKWIEQ